MALRLIPLVLVTPNDPWSPPQSIAERLTTALLTNRSLSFDVAAGYDATVGHYLGRDTENRDQYVEFTFWGMNDWNENQRVNALRSTHENSDDPNNVITYTYGDLFSLFPAEVGGFNRVETYSAYYSSEINNFELNARIRPRGRADRLVLQPNGKWQRECQPGKTLSYLIGFRYLSLDEGFGFRSSGNFTDDNGVTTPVSGAYDILTHNDMFGPQIGADLMFSRCQYSFGVQAKLAPLINFADQSSAIVTDAAGDPLATYGDINDFRYAKKDDCSLVGEVNILGNYRIRKNMVLHAGYHFLWITGLALAAEQIQFQPNAADAINENGHAFYHGISGGLECIW